MGKVARAIRSLISSAAPLQCAHCTRPKADVKRTNTADYARGTVVHRIEGEIPPNPGITEVATPFRVSGATLILGNDSGSHWRFLRVR